MLCKDANSKLVEYADGELAPADHQAVESHLNDCAICSSDYGAISHLQAMAVNWQEKTPPEWSIPQMSSEANQGFNGWLENFRDWFPTFASATALVLVTVMYFSEGEQNGSLPQPQVANIDSLPELPQAQQAAFVDSVLKTSREQRQEEFSALLEYITAEMNRRSIETEESLRFILSSQLEGQRELDHLYQQIEQLAVENEPAQPGIKELSQ